MSVFPLSSTYLFVFSIAEFIIGAMKSMFSFQPFLLFSGMELVFCTVISVSIGGQLSQLSFPESKAVFSLAIFIDFLILLLDIGTGLFFMPDSPSNHNSNRQALSIWNNVDIRSLSITFLYVYILFLPAICILLAALSRINFDLLTSNEKNFHVGDLLVDGHLSRSFYLTLLALLLMFAVILVLMSTPIIEPQFVRPICFIVLSMGTILFALASLHAHKHTLGAYLLIILTTFAPLFSFIITASICLQTNIFLFCSRGQSNG